MLEMLHLLAAYHIKSYCTVIFVGEIQISINHEHMISIAFLMFHQKFQLLQFFF